jgi:hypothetical protein
MAFSYDLSTASGQLRLQLGDTVYESGVRPDSTNLSDEELAVFLAREGQDVMRATAAACEALSVMWSVVANIAVGPRREELGAIAGQYARRAETLRQQYGGSTGSGFAVSWHRSDGYSDRSSTGESATLSSGAASAPEYGRRRYRLRLP